VNRKMGCRWLHVLSMVALLALQASCFGDSRQVLLSAKVPRPAGGEALVFELREGDNVADAVSVFALEQQLTQDEEAGLLGAVNREAVRLRLVPVKSLQLTLKNGATMPLDVYQGDDIREKVFKQGRSAGVTNDEWLDEMTLHVVGALKKERVVPILALNVTVPSGSTEALHLFEGDTQQDVVQDFVQQHGLNEGQAQSLAAQVKSRMLMHGLVPVIELPVGETLVFKLFHGEAIAEAAGRFCKTNSLPADQESQLVRETTRRALELGLLPYAVVDVEIPVTGDVSAHSESLSVRAGENVTEVVSGFAKQHALSKRDEASILAAVVKQGTESRVLPALEFPVYLTAPGNDVDAEGVTFQLFQGDDAAVVVKRFAQKHGIDASREEALLNHTTGLAKSSRLMPVAVLTVNVTTPEGNPAKVIPVSIPIYQGDSVRQQAEAKARDMEFPEEVVNGLAESAVAEARKNRLEPVLMFNVTVDEQMYRVPAFAGDNITEVALGFARQVNLTQEETEKMLGDITLVAMQERLLPMISIPVRITLDDTGNTTAYALEVYHGQNIEEAVDGFLKPLDLAEAERESARKNLLSRASNAAYDNGLVPLMKVQVEFRGQKDDLRMYKGDTPQQAVARFLQTRELPAGWTDENRLALEEVVTMHAQEGRLLPVMQLDLVAGDRNVPLYLFKGDNITQTMEHVQMQLQLTPEDRVALESDVISKAKARRLVPTLSIPVKLDGGDFDNFLLFHGDDIKTAVAQWAESHNLPGEQVEVLEEATTVRATQDRIIPALKLDVHVGGVPQDLLLYAGDNITVAVQSFIEQHGLDASEGKTLSEAVMERAVSQRLMPMHVIPVEVEGEGGEVVSSKDLLLFKVPLHSWEGTHTPATNSVP